MQPPPQGPLQPHSQPAPPQRGLMRGQPLAEIWGAMRFLGYSPTLPPEKSFVPPRRVFSTCKTKRPPVRPPPLGSAPPFRGGPVRVPAFPRTSSVLHPIFGAGGRLSLLCRLRDNGDTPSWPQKWGEQAEPAHHPPPICTHIPLCLHHLTPHASLHAIGRTRRFFLPPPSLPAPWISIFPFFFFFFPSPLPPLEGVCYFRAGWEDPSRISRRQRRCIAGYHHLGPSGILRPSRLDQPRRGSLSCPAAAPAPPRLPAAPRHGQVRASPARPHRSDHRAPAALGRRARGTAGGCSEGRGTRRARRPEGSQGTR